MEMLIDGFDDETKEEYQEYDGQFLDVCEWSCITCDDDERVTEMEIDSKDLSGSPDLCHIPPKVQSLIITSRYNGELIGSVDLTHLPDGMEYISIYNNELTGEIDLGQLPDGIEYISLNNNEFTGEINLAHLPEGLQRLSLSWRINSRGR